MDKEALTVQAPGITGMLDRTRRATSPIENLNGSLAHCSLHVKRGGGDQMAKRRIASASTQATRTRKLRDCGQMQQAG